MGRGAAPELLEAPMLSYTGGLASAGKPSLPSLLYFGKLNGEVTVGTRAEPDAGACSVDADADADSESECDAEAEADGSRCDSWYAGGSDASNGITSWGRSGENALPVASLLPLACLLSAPLPLPFSMAGDESIRGSPVNDECTALQWGILCCDYADSTVERVYCGLLYHVIKRRDTRQYKYSVLMDYELGAVQ